jgi:hypothetical protein
MHQAVSAAPIQPSGCAISARTTAPTTKMATNFHPSGWIGTITERSIAGRDIRQFLIAQLWSMNR